MDKFTWTEEHSVGIKEIDDQHRHFFDIANGILDLVERGDLSKENIIKHLEEMGDYAFYHFSTEEKYFDQFNYEDAPIHISAHNEYRKTITDYFDEIKKEGADFNKIAQEMTAYSGKWLLTHIIVVDKQYTKFFNERGLN